MTMILRKYRSERVRRRGMALVIAISLLALFSTLGMLYVRRMNLEIARADMLLAEARARQAATAGFQAALAELERALENRQSHQVVGKPKRYDFPVYSGALADGTPTREASDRRRAYADVIIADENAKVNLNHAPASVLQMILGVDGATARAIAASLPRDGAAFSESDEEAHRQWLLEPGDLVARGLITPEQFDAVNREHVTTYTVPDHDNPVGFININTAPAEVMAAVLDMSVKDAGKVITRRPFRTLAALAAAAGKDPATFNIRPDPNNPSSLPAPLAFESRCFQIVSEAVCANVAGKQEYDKVHARVDAIVYFPPDGGYEIVKWNARRGA